MCEILGICSFRRASLKDTHVIYRWSRPEVLTVHLHSIYIYPFPKIHPAGYVSDIRRRTAFQRQDMSFIASQIAGTCYSTFYSVYKNENNKGPHFWPLVIITHRSLKDSFHKGTVMRKLCPFYTPFLRVELLIPSFFRGRIMPCFPYQIGKFDTCISVFNKQFLSKSRAIRTRHPMFNDKLRHS